MIAPSRAAQLHTFLIADVRGYTRYTQQRGDEAAAELASAFAELVGEAVAAHEGRVIELRGDEALVAFDSARQALQAALAIQAVVGERGSHVALASGSTPVRRSRSARAIEEAR